MTVNYEWDVETQAAGDSGTAENGDVLDHDFCSSYAEAVRNLANDPAQSGEYKVIVLIRDDDICKAWAYMEDGKLPEFFTDAYGNEDAKVPKRFHAEVYRTA